MFSKFLQSQSCMKLLSWILEHPLGEYQAPIVHIECDSPSMGDFMAAITILQGVDIIRVNEVSEDLIISFNPDSSISQLLTHFKDEFNYLAFSNMNVSPALSYLYSPAFKNQIDAEVLGQTTEVDLPKLLEFCKNFEDEDIDNSLKQDIHDLCLEMKENGTYNDFIRFMESKIDDEK